MLLLLLPSSIYIPLHVCQLDDELFLDMLENWQVEQAHAGINALALSQETINKLRENFIDIDK